MKGKRTRFILLLLCALLAVAGPSWAQDGLSPAGKLFLKDAASIDQMEIRLGQLAREKGSSREVRDFGDRMVLDHANANDELQVIAGGNNLKLPGQVERKHRVTIVRLSKFSGSEFDRNYLLAVVKSHSRNITRLKKAMKDLDDQELKAWGARNLPILEQHLRHARELMQSFARL